MSQMSQGSSGRLIKPLSSNQFLKKNMKLQEQQYVKEDEKHSKQLMSILGETDEDMEDMLVEIDDNDVRLERRKKNLARFKMKPLIE